MPSWYVLKEEHPHHCEATVTFEVIKASILCFRHEVTGAQKGLATYPRSHSILAEFLRSTVTANKNDMFNPH